MLNPKVSFTASQYRIHRVIFGPDMVVGELTVQVFSGDGREMGTEVMALLVPQEQAGALQACCGACLAEFEEETGIRGIAGEPC